MTEYASVTTLNRIRAASPCQEGWTKLLKNLSKTAADNAPLGLLTILDSNGFDDALWVLSFAMPDDRLARHLQAWCAEQVLPIFEREHPDDTRVRDQIAMLRRDDASHYERVAAKSAASVATNDAFAVGSADAWYAARSAAYFAVREAAHFAVSAAGSALSAEADAVHTAAWNAQERQLRKMITGSA